MQYPLREVINMMPLFAFRAEAQSGCKKLKLFFSLSRKSAILELSLKNHFGLERLLVFDLGFALSAWCLFAYGKPNLEQGETGWLVALGPLEIYQITGPSEIMKALVGNLAKMAEN